MFAMQVLGTVATSGTATANMVRGEPNPASEAETNVDMDVDEDDLPRNSEEGIATEEEDGELVDFNEDGTAAAAEAAIKLAYLNDLREMFANKGKEYRAFLNSEKVKDLYTSPMTVEMSAEDILAEIPQDELHLVGMVRGMLPQYPYYTLPHHSTSTLS
jgi:hypothetical protein